MEPEPHHRGDPDGGADTESFRAFVERGELERPRATGAPLRILTLLSGMAVFAVLVRLLPRL